MLMIFFAHYVVSRFPDVVAANLTIVAIIDMPIFVIAIVYGLLWRRTNWQGAVGGYVIGAVAGTACYLFFKGDPDLSDYRIVQVLFGDEVSWGLWAKSLAAIASTLAALIGTPAVTLCFKRAAPSPEMARVFDAFHSTADEDPGRAGFHLWPATPRGRAGVGLMAIGFLVFLAGVLSASVGFGYASQLAVGGMLIFFTGGLLRVYSD
jgi:SSS family solute:Na+ symporter